MKQLTLENTDTEQALSDLEERFFEIPFENSDFQNKNFIIQGQHTPARAYRAIGLKMFSKLNAIKELKFGREMEDVDIEEHEWVIANSEDRFAVKRAAINIRKLESGRGYTNKLLNDAIAELNFLHNELQKYPQYTKETFEAEERLHYSKSMEVQINSGGDGAKQSLHNMSIGEGYASLLSFQKEKDNEGALAKDEGDFIEQLSLQNP